MSEELYQFVACDYFATGEGRTICLLITRAYPMYEDYATEPSFTENGFHPGILSNSAKFRAAREFVKHFGSYYAQGAENLPKEEFIEKFGRFIPEPVLKLLQLEGDDCPGNLSFRQEFHFNFS
jgi:hypothetical protein